MKKSVTLTDANKFPIWQQPIALLFIMTAAMPLSFSVWSALLNNFTIEVIGFDGADIGWLHGIREIPGFLAVGVIAIIIFMHEQTLALVSLLMLGAATTVTACFPHMAGILTITMLSSIGFHYYETINQSLQLQWLKKEEAPRKLGLLIGAGSGAALIAYVLLVLSWKSFNLSYNLVYLIAGAATVLITLYCVFAFPRFVTPHSQIKKMILRKRYWLYYALQFMAGARRQIFVVFASFMMVEHFGMRVDQITYLYLINLVINMVAAPLMGRAVGRFGERNALLFEYLGLVLVFLAYGGIYFFDWGMVLAAALYVLDHIFFSLALAMKTYFQKIADPEDIAPTAAVAFTINHISAVFLPILLGYVWLYSPAFVFFSAAGFSAVSFGLALLIPRNPKKGLETVFSRLNPRWKTAT